MIMPIDKNRIPYSIRIQLGGFEYKIVFHYNAENDSFTVDLYFQDEPEVLAEPLLLNNPLFHDFPYSNIPPVVLMPMAVGDEPERIGFQELGESVNVYLIGGDDLESAVSA